MTPSHYRQDIDGLRAIAVLAVVAYHSFPQFLSGGFAGVDVFFVISGFLISGILFRELEAQKFKLSNFYSRRIRRIFPALIIVLIGTWGFSLFYLTPLELKILGKHVLAGAGFMSNVVLFSEAGYFDVQSDHKPLLHLWSLGVEEQYYIFWPAFLALLHRIKNRTKKINGLAPIVLLLLASFAASLIRTKSHPSEAFFLPHTRLWELALGSLLALNLKEGARWSFKGAAPLLGLGFLVAGFVLFDRSTEFPGWRALLPTIGTALIILSNEQSWLNRNILSNSLMVRLGAISYPLYLWHWPVFSFARILYLSEPSPLVMLGLILVSLALSVLTYFAVEKPIRFGIFSRSSVILPLGITMTLVAVLGAATSRNGFDFRIPAEVRFLSQYSKRYDLGDTFMYGKCFVVLTDHHSDFSPDCVDSGFTSSPKSVLIFGDSYGAMLFTGFEELKKHQDLKLARFAIGGCDPHTEQEKPDCVRHVGTILQKVKELRPAVVVIVASWMNRVPRLNAKFAKTFKELRSLGASRIIVIGPFPEWKKYLPYLLYAVAMRDSNHQIPTRMSYGLNSITDRIDQDLRSLAKSSEVEYIAPINSLCNPEGCLTLVGGNVAQFDTGHLTPEASILFVKENFSTLFQPAR